MTLDEEIPDGSNRDAKKALNTLINSIVYHPNTPFNREDVIIQIREQFIYSKAFRLNEEQTAENKRIILESSKENTLTPEEESPKTISPESDSIKSKESDDQ